MTPAEQQARFEWMKAARPGPFVSWWDIGFIWRAFLSARMSDRENKCELRDWWLKQITMEQEVQGQ